MKIPVLFYWTGNHADYHRPSDTADKINIPGLGKIVDLAQETIEHLATVSERPAYVEIPRPAQRMRAGGGPRLGIMPGYADEGKEGVLVEGVTEGGPAAKAGLKAKDRIVEITGKAVTSLETYMALMAGQRPKDTIDVVILRDGKRMSVKVKLE
jgi:S1-C subfamily serine protease